MVSAKKSAGAPAEASLVAASQTRPKSGNREGPSRPDLFTSTPALVVTMADSRCSWGLTSPVTTGRRRKEDCMIPEFSRRNTLRITSCAFLIFMFAFPTIGPQTAEAEPVSKSVRRACVSDYFAFCSSHRVGSPSLRKCMRDAGAKLSRGCFEALVEAGEVSSAEASQRSARR